MEFKIPIVIFDLYIRLRIPNLEFIVLKTNNILASSFTPSINDYHVFRGSPTINPIIIPI